MASTNMTDGSTIAYAAWGNDVDAVVYEQHGVGKTTVASATTPDIFAVTTGSLIDYTGTATCTGFVAAVSAGSHRTLYCAGACLFTAGANLLIEGIPSGTTITLAAGALVEVIAITTTQFKMTYSVSGTFTASCANFTVTQNVTASYTLENGAVKLTIPSITGTSNSGSFTITGFPVPIRPAATAYLPIMEAVSGGASVYAFGYVYTGGGIDMYNGHNLAGFSATGTKTLLCTEFSYKIA